MLRRRRSQPAAPGRQPGERFVPETGSIMLARQSAAITIRPARKTRMLAKLVCFLIGALGPTCVVGWLLAFH
jgi:hypothetical protein